MSEQQFRMVDTKRPDGCYVMFERVIEPDAMSDPHGRMLGNPKYNDESQARLHAYYRDEWRYVGIRAKAHVLVVRNGTGSMTTLISPGLWGVESDNGEEYFQELYEEEIEALKDMIAAMATPIYGDATT